MKRILFALLCLFAVAADAQTNGVKISAYPRTTTYQSSDLILITRPGVTNLGIRADDFGAGLSNALGIAVTKAPVRDASGSSILLDLVGSDTVIYGAGVTQITAGENGLFLADQAGNHQINVTADNVTIPHLTGVNSNSLDAATKALLGTGSSVNGTNLPNLTVTNAAAFQADVTVGGFLYGDGSRLSGISSNGFTFVSVNSYNADPTGVSDSSSAFQWALSNAVVYVPSGTYKIGTSLWTKVNGRIFGDGSSSILIRSGTATNILNTTNVTWLDGLVFDVASGKTNYTINHSDLPADGTYSGVRLDARGDPYVHNVTFRNADAVGLYVAGDSDENSRQNKFRIEGCLFTNNFRALHLAGNNQAEYGRVVANMFSRNWVGIDCQSANNEIVGNQIDDSNFGYYLHPDNGRGHSLFSGTANHSIYPVYITNVTTGCLIQGSHFLGGNDIFVTNSLGVQFKGNYFELSTAIEDAGTNEWRNNTFSSGSWNTNGVHDASRIHISTNMVGSGNYKIGYGPVLNNKLAGDGSALTGINATLPSEATFAKVTVTGNQGIYYGTSGTDEINCYFYTDNLSPMRYWVWNKKTLAYDQAFNFKYYNGSGSETNLFAMRTNGVFAALSSFSAGAMPEYADNAAAVAAGLAVGDFYRTGDNLKIVH